MTLTDPNYIISCFSGFGVTLFFIFGLANFSKHAGLIDQSQGINVTGGVPLIGGIAIFLALLIGALIWGASGQAAINIKGGNALWALLGCCGLIVCVGALDDRHNLGVATRLVAEILIALTIIHIIDLRLIWLGDLLGSGPIKMSPAVSYVFTTVAIFGLLNAFNMLDGVDGLLASMTIFTTIFFHLAAGIEFSLEGIYILSCLTAFLISNTGAAPFLPKTFLGDSGSKLIGFIAVCFLLTAASGRVGAEKLIDPSTALFLVALPLFDMVWVTLRRLINRSSPFQGDQSHIHHILLALNLSHRSIVLVLVSVNLVLAGTGLALHAFQVAEYHQFQIFVLLFLSYCVGSNMLRQRANAT